MDSAARLYMELVYLNVHGNRNFSSNKWETEQMKYNTVGNFSFMYRIVIESYELEHFNFVV